MRTSHTVLDVSARGAVLAAAALLACLGGSASAQEVYRSVDAQGRVVFSDRGGTKDAPKTPVRIDKPDPAEVARLAKEQNALQDALRADDSARARQQAADDKQKAVRDHNRQVACEKARNNYYRLNDARSIYKRDADGNRVYYDDAEADAVREQARRAMTAACGA